MSQGEQQSEVRSVSLTVLDAPTGKGRPRFDTRSGRAYTPSATRNAETHVRAAWLAAGQPRLPDDEPLHVEIDLWLERPLDHWRRDGSLTAKGARTTWAHRKKPDVDNAAKLILDALEGYAYKRDVAVVGLAVCKHWCDHGERQHTEVRIRCMPSGLVVGPQASS